MPIETQGMDYDVAVIGAGINGASAARELAVAGYSVLLVDKYDFAAGASSRSSRILHCGLRYFETRDPVRTFALHPLRFVEAMRMARTAMQAREELVRLEPARCKPFTMCFPVFRESAIRGYHLDLAFGILRRFEVGDPPLDYRRLRADFETHVPFARDLRSPECLESLALFREYIIDWPERLCVEAALEAEAYGATVRTFCEARIERCEADGSWTLALCSSKHTSEIARARVILNMAGNSIDAVNATAPRQAKRLVQSTKGAHILVRLPDVYRGFGIATMNRRGNPFYCLPWRDDYFYFGPTETPFDGPPGDVAADDEDIDFLLDEANYLLPGLRLDRRRIELTWAGVRPLTFDPQQTMGRRTREIHDLKSANMPGIFAMTAGPVMSYRSAGREMLGVVERYLGRPQRTNRPGRSTTGEQIFSFDVKEFYFPEAPVGRRAAFHRAVAEEHARDLDGILRTRTGIAWGRPLAREELVDAAESVSGLLGWSSQRAAEEIERFIQRQETVFGRAGALSSRGGPTEATTLIGGGKA